MKLSKRNIVGLCCLLLLLFSCPAVLNLPDFPTEGMSALYTGTGVIPAIATAGDMTVAAADKIDILILAEGYQAADLGAFNTDATDWLAKAQLVEPLRSFGGAFNVRKYALASNEHVKTGATKAADTAFAVTVDADGNIRDDLDRTAALVWKLAADLDILKDNYYPAGGDTQYINKQLVVCILVYDPATGASGFSGIGRRLTNPDNDFQRISAAFARNATHEYLHAFARLADEYLENDSGLLGESDAAAVLAPTLSNVVNTINRDTVPWKHLEPGGAYNLGTQYLIGWFGNAKNGYHSEAKCLMNGTHDNILYYGGNGNLRTTDRLCNWCREITVFRVFEHLNMLSTFANWIANYRDKYYAEFILDIPPGELPRKNSAGEVIMPAEGGDWL